MLGLNKDGQLGDGTRADAGTPVRVAGAPCGLPWHRGDASCGLAPTARCWCWGGNRYSQLGPAATGSGSRSGRRGPSASGPVTAAGCTAVAGPAPGCWGSNEAGQLGTARRGTRDACRARCPWGPGTAYAGRAGRWTAAVAGQAIRVGDRAGVGAARKKKVVHHRGDDLQPARQPAHRPGGARPNFAPGRVRSEWAKNLINERGATLIGVYEPQPDQIASLDVATDGDFSIYPGNTMGYAGAPQSVMWKDAEWSLVWDNTITIPFMKESRPQPIVRLRNKSTGREIYWINAHLSPGKMQADRDKGMDIIKQVIKTLGGDGLPILLTGDFNEHARAFCQITGTTALRAAVGGSTRGSKCKPPKGCASTGSSVAARSDNTRSTRAPRYGVRPTTRWSCRASPCSSVRLPDRASGRQGHGQGEETR